MEVIIKTENNKKKYQKLRNIGHKFMFYRTYNNRRMINYNFRGAELNIPNLRYSGKLFIKFEIEYLFYVGSKLYAIIPKVQVVMKELKEIFKFI